MKKFIFFFFFGALFLGIHAQRDWWDVTGNDVDPRLHFFGATNCAPLIFKTNNNERMRMLSDKSFLGIGISNPFATLHLHHQVDARPCEEYNSQLIPRKLLQLTTSETGSNVNNGFSIFSMENKEIIFQQQEQAIFSIQGLAGGLTISPNGNIGIQNDNPQARLDVDGDIKAGSAKIIGSGLSSGFKMSYNNTDITLKQQEQGKLFIEGTGGGFMIAPNGNIGMGTEQPVQKLHVVDENILISKTGPNVTTFKKGIVNFETNYGNSGSWGIECVNSFGEGFGLEFWKDYQAALPGGRFYTALFLGDNRCVGIGTKTPEATLDVYGSFKAQSANIMNTLTANQVNANSFSINQLNAQNANINGSFSVNEGISKLSIGSAYFSNLSYGTAYIGFNATRNNGIWTLTGDGANNGGGVIWTAVDGSILFASIPKSGGGNRTLTDAQIKDNIKLYLTPAGKLRAKSVEVSLTGWPDYVFEENYKLLPLNEVEQFIQQNNRLPDIPSAKEIEENGLNIGEMQSKLLLKIEELTLYILDLQKQIDELKKQ